MGGEEEGRQSCGEGGEVGLSLVQQLFLIAAFLLFVGCSSKKSVEAYGAEKFAHDVLEFPETGKLNQGIQA
jgi:hypothetical protein